MPDNHASHRHNKGLKRSYKELKLAVITDHEALGLRV